jgi:hypothetical protein
VDDIKDHDQTVRRVTHHLDQEEAGAPAMMRQNLEAITTARVEGDYCTFMYNHTSACLRRRSAVEIRRSQCSEKKQPRTASSLRTRTRSSFSVGTREAASYCSGSLGSDEGFMKSRPASLEKGEKEALGDG